MNFDEYQNATEATAIYYEPIVQFRRKPSELQEDWLAFAYCVGKLNGEAGELAEEVFKALRDDNGLLTGDRLVRMKKELGDVLWYCARIATQMGFDLSQIAEDNINKLSNRKEAGTLHGDGSER